MSGQWQQLRDRLDSFSLRERGLILLSMLALIYLLWDFALYRPLAEQRGQVEQALAEAEQKVSAMRQEQDMLTRALSAGPNRALRQERQELEGRMAVLDANLSELSVGLVPADQLAAILQDVLAKTESLKLHSLQTLPVEELQLTVKTDADAANAGVYKHSVALTLRGSYFEVLDYLRRLEELSWRFYWDELRFEQSAWPKGLYQIRVYTLSTDEGLFGV